MSPLYLRLAAEMFQRYIYGRVSRNCSDWQWPEWFPVAEREPLVREMERRNHRHHAVTPEIQAEIEESVQMYATKADGPPDWWVSEVLCEMIAEMGEAS